MEIITEYKIDYSLITPSGKRWDTEGFQTPNGQMIHSIEDAKAIEQKSVKRYTEEGYKVLSHKILSRTITVTDWKERR